MKPSQMKCDARFAILIAIDLALHSEKAPRSIVTACLRMHEFNPAQANNQRGYTVARDRMT